MAVTKRVHIYESDGEYRVHPPLVELDGTPANADSLIIKNNTNDDLVFYVGPKVFDPAAVARPIDSGKKITLTAQSQGANGSNAYTYQVIVPKSGKKAKGNSDPVIIIEN